jgi:hypothetical protein
LNSCAQIATAATQSIFRPEAEDAENMWIRPVFDAKSGKLKTHKGRIEETEGDDNEKIFSKQASHIF